MPTKAATDAWNRRHPEVKRCSVRKTQARKLISSDPLTTGDELQWAENAISIHELAARLSRRQGLNIQLEYVAIKIHAMLR